MATVYQRAALEKTDAGAFSTNLGINKLAKQPDPEAAYPAELHITCRARAFSTYPIGTCNH